MDRGRVYRRTRADCERDDLNYSIIVSHICNPPVFDDSFDHEVWMDGGEAEDVRIVLIVDVWHPQLTDEQKRQLHPI